MDSFEMEMQMPEEKVKRKPCDKKKLFIFLGILCFALLVAGVIVLRSPKVVIARSVTNAVEDFGKRDELAFLLEMMDGGSLELDAKGENVSLEGKLYMDTEEYCMLADSVTYKSGSETYCASAFAGPSGIWLQSQKGLPRGVYGLTPGFAVNNLKKAWEMHVYPPMNGKAHILEAIAQVIDDGEGEELIEDILDVTQEVQKERYRLLLAYAELDVDTKTVRIDGESVKARVYELVLDESALDGIELEFYDYLAQSRSVKKLLQKYESFFAYLMGDTILKEDVLDLFDKWLEESEKAVDNEGLTYTLKLTTKLYTSTMLEFSVFCEAEVEDATYDVEVFSVKCGADGMKKSDCLEFVFLDVTYTYEIIKADDRRFHATLSSEWLEVDFSHNKERGYFIFDTAVIYEGEKTKLLYVEGDLFVEKGRAELVSEKVYFNKQEANLSIKLCLSKEDEMPDHSYDATALYDYDFDKARWKIEEDWWNFVNKYS